MEDRKKLLGIYFCHFKILITKALP